MHIAVTGNIGAGKNHFDDDAFQALRMGCTI